jgi:hypothetical protein
MSQPEAPGDALQSWAVSQGYADARVLRDGRLVIVERLFGHAALLWVGTLQAHEDAWCYATCREAVAAAHTWDGTGEPQGWVRHPASGRRRPGGDPERESRVPSGEALPPSPGEAAARSTTRRSHRPGRGGAR